MQTIIVDMTPGFRMPTIYYSQGDVGTQFAIDLRSRFGDSFPTGTTVTIQATKPSGFGFSVAATSVTNGVATFTTTAEMTDEFGRFPAELKVAKTGLTLFTANFYMDGERNTHPEGTTDGSQETVIPELTQLVERVEDAASSVLDMTVEAETLAAGSDATYSYDEETNTATFGIPKGADGSLASGVLAPTYSSSSTYAVGDYVYYSGSLYRCTTAITTAEAWTSGHWTQVALAPEVSDLKADIGEFAYDWVNGKFVNYNTGQEGAVASYDCTDYILCDSVGISVKTEVASADTAGICFYDNNKNFISGFNPSANNYNFFNLTIPTNATYVRVSCLDRYKSNFGIKRYDSISKIQKGIGNIKGNVSSVQNEVAFVQNCIEKSANILPINGNTETWVNVSMSYADGVLSFSGTASGSGGRTKRLTAPIALEAGTYTFWAKNISGVSDTTLYIENASSDAIIADIANGNAWSKTFTLNADTSVYLGANVVSGTTYSSSCLVMLEKSSSKSEYEAPSFASAIDAEARKGLLALQSFWSYAMDKVLCIGDSLTSGACFTGNWDGASIDQNYPRLLGRMLDADVTNAGVSGLTASQWYANEISKYTLANYDTFIIWLGTNGGLTDTLDTDVNPYQDYNDFADTNTGNYCKIIERIKANNSDCLIILTKVFVSDTTNTVIDKIATKYSLPVVDNSDLTVANYPALHGNIDNPHFTKAGNLFIADRYAMTMAEVFAENPAMTNYGLTARTN